MKPDTTRYQGRPLLRLLECYVLWAIDSLSDADAARLSEMTPKLRSIYRAEGNWPDVLATVMEMAPDTPERIRGLWAKNQEIAKRNSTTLTPQQFAEMFVDRNWRD